MIFECPKCSELIDAEEQSVGTRQKCPHCHETIILRGPPPSPQRGTLTGDSASSKRRTAKPTPKERVASLLVLVVMGFGICYFTNGFNGRIKEFYTPPEGSVQSDQDRISAMIAWYHEADFWNHVSVDDTDAKRLAEASIKVDPDNAEDVFQRVVYAIVNFGGLTRGLKQLTETGKMNDLAKRDLIAISRLQGAPDEELVYKVLVAMAPDAPSAPIENSASSVETNSAPYNENLVATPPPAPGSTIVIQVATPLYFHDQVYRVAQPGEEFQVYEYRPNEKRLYILSKDANGNPIGLNIPDK